MARFPAIRFTFAARIPLVQSGKGGQRLTKATWDLPRTLGALRKSSFSEDRIGSRSVKDEIRSNLICRLQRGTPLFPGIVGYEETVLPQVVNALLSRHN